MCLNCEVSFLNMIYNFLHGDLSFSKDDTRLHPFTVYCCLHAHRLPFTFVYQLPFTSVYNGNPFTVSRLHPVYTVTRLQYPVYIPFTMVTHPRSHHIGSLTRINAFTLYCSDRNSVPGTAPAVFFQNGEVLEKGKNVFVGQPVYSGQWFSTRAVMTDDCR